MASLKALIASAVSVGDDDDPADVITKLRPHAEKLGAGPDGFAWYDPAKHDKYSARAIVKQLAIGLSSQKVATFIVGKDQRVGFVPWSDKAKILAESKSSTIKAKAIGPTKPANVRRAKPPKPGVLRMHLRQEGIRSYVGFDAGPPLRDDVRTTGELDLSKWPPVYRPRLDMLGIRAARAADGRLVSAGVTVGSPKGPRPEALHVFDGQTKRVLNDLVPNYVSLDIQQIHGVGFINDDIILLPSEPAYRGGKVKRPLVLRPKSKMFVELDELPAVNVAKFTKTTFPPFAVHGFARTGAGDDVLLWSDGGYTGPSYKRTYDLGKLEPREISCAPGIGDSFFACSRESIFQIRAGERPKQRLAKAGRIMSIAAGPPGVVLAAIIRAQPKLPIMVVWWPDSREWASIKGEMFGFTGKVWFSQGHVGYNPTSKLVWGFEPIEDELRAIEWDDVAALKRVPE